MSERTKAIREFHECRNFGTADKRRSAQRNVAAAYRSLSSEECSTLAQFAIENGNEAILSHLACFHPDSLIGKHLELVQKGLIYPPEILNGAEDEAATLLVEQLEDGTAENVNLSLLVLAWAGNSVVVDAFRRWRSDPPPWCGPLHVPPHEYADSGGWELTESGDRRELVLARMLHPRIIDRAVGV